MLLLDAPFRALDATVRKDLRRGLREIHDRTGLTTVFVTHDQDEAMELADLVVVMSMGGSSRSGSRPASSSQPSWRNDRRLALLGASPAAAAPAVAPQGRANWWAGRLVQGAPQWSGLR
nr:sulfate ABC transporter ATPase [Oceanicola sp. S124]